MFFTRLSLALALAAPAIACADGAAADACAGTDEDVACLAPLQVLGRRENLMGTARTASEGLVGPTEMAARPRLRSGDLLEFVPGLVATQHSGSGKANQYFLRGFNLDHGTDFASFVDGMPVNLRSHGHGQGYTDLNFLIPELVEEIEYRKGPYAADVGDFSAAGSARFRLADVLRGDAVELALGEFGFKRGVLTQGLRAGDTDLVLGAELQRYDGPWSDIEEDVRKHNLVLRASRLAGDGVLHVAGMAYDNEWRSPDQVPTRAIASGLIDRFGSLDTTLGGESSRYSLSGGWDGAFGGGEASVSAYAIDSSLDLYSNFTYLLDDPVAGDQFRQFDARRLYGADANWRRDLGSGWWRVGAETRHDDIEAVGLARTQARALRGFVREDAVEESSAGAYVDGEWRFAARWRLYGGVRLDRYAFEVEALQAENSGRRHDTLASPKLGLAWAAHDALELYASAGRGFHSNDARGTTLRVDPIGGAPAAAVDPLVRSRGAELGARWFLGETLHATAALWRLDLDAELLFVGDAGNTEASRPSARRGVEVGVYWLGRNGWRGELEAAVTDAGFEDGDPSGREIPGSIPRVLGVGLSYDGESGWFGALRVRHFGGYPLREDGSVRADGSTLVNASVGKRWGAWRVSFDLLNALDSDDHDIDYYYASRLPGEAGAVDDVHFHGFEPRALRLGVQYRWD